MNTLSIWNQVQNKLKEQIGSASYETWFSSIQVKEKSPSTILIEAPDEFFKNWIIDHYQIIIENAINEQSGESVAVEFSVNQEVVKIQPATSFSSDDPPAPERLEKNKKENLNPRFSFNNFVIGPSNRFTYAACMAVAESPAKAYNPLFIYGQVGLGKTHLMQAITHQLKTNHPNLNCYYLSSEKFTNELIDAIRHRSTSQFRQKYRNIDVLLIDDIHFIAGKESTQEEFFHTFNALHNSRKQIIISSDRPPKEIANLEERLSSRFAWGLSTDIKPPDYETRVAILKKKTERERVDIPDEVISFIAEQITSNIRELEGAMIRVIAYSLLEEKPVSLEMAKSVLKDLVRETIKNVNIENIQKEVADFFNISIGDIKAKKRSKNIMLPRQIAMFLARQLTSMSLPEIGLAFGGKDHTTVLHSCRKIEQEIQKNMEIKNTINTLSMGLKK